MDIMCRGLRVELSGRPVLHGVGLSIADGEQVALLGPSGVGKTTLLRALLGAVAARGGTVRVGGRDPHGARRDATAIRRATGVVRQRDDLVRGLTARTNILIGDTRGWRAADWLTVMRGHTPRHYADRLAELAARHGIGELLGARIENLSGGQRQRVALVRALLPRPSLILADESTAGLDPVRAGEALRHLRSAGATLVVTTHDVPTARQFPRIIALREGAVAFDGAALSDADIRGIYGEPAPVDIA